MWELVAAWYLDALEGLLRSGLSSGYRVTKDQLLTARGSVVPVETTRLVMRGRPVLYCEYEEFDVDTALNRVLRAAAVAIAGNAALPWTSRQRAARAVQHMAGVGRLTPADITVARPERHTTRYVVPVQLARHVLAGTGRAIDTGDEHGFAFLIRTPEMVEKALRKIVVEALSDDVGVVKQTRFLSGSHHSLTPDLVFGTGAVGDVKYKLWSGDWDRPDLYQLVAFATGFGVTHGLRVGFTTAPHGPCSVNVGSVRLAACDWVCDESLAPGEAEAALVAGLSAWWGACCGVMAASSGP